MKQVQVLIVGQGLAGSILAHHLHEQNISFCILDQNHFKASSKVAAGLVNPVTGFRLTLDDDFEQQQSTSRAFFQKTQKNLNTSLIQDLEQVRWISHPRQQAILKSRLSDVRYANCFSNSETSGKLHRVKVMGTYRIFVDRFLKLTRNCFSEQIKQIRFDYDSLAIRDGYFDYGELRAKHVVFCEGHLANQNPWFQHLEFNLSRGDIISLSSQELPQQMIHFGRWLIPGQNKLYKLGATYDANNIDGCATKSDFESLLDALGKAYPKLNYSIEAHEWGIRPTTLRHEPFVEAHPVIRNMYVFNGFGSKGCLTIPSKVKRLLNLMNLSETA